MLWILITLLNWQYIVCFKMAISNNSAFKIIPTLAVHRKYVYVCHQGYKTLGDCLYAHILCIMLNFKL